MTYKQYLREMEAKNATTEDSTYGTLVMTKLPYMTNYKGKAVYEAEAVRYDEYSLDEDGCTPRFVCRWWCGEGDLEDIDWSHTDATIESVLQWDGEVLN